MYYLIYIMHSLVIQIRQKYNKWMFSFCFFYYPGIFLARFPKNQERTKKEGEFPPSSYMVNHHIFKHVVKNIIFDEKNILKCTWYLHFSSIQKELTIEVNAYNVFSHAHCNNLLSVSMLKVTKSSSTEPAELKWAINVIYSQSSLKYPVYSNLPLSPAKAGTFPVCGESKRIVQSQML